MMGLVEFNSDDHYISFCGQESFRRNSPHNQQKNPKCGTWVQSQNQKYDLSLFPRQAIQQYSNPSLGPNYWCQRSWIWLAFWRPIRPSRINTKKCCPFSHKRLECKNRKSRDTWSNRQSLALGYKMNQSKRQQSFIKRKQWSYQILFSNNTRDDSTHGHHQIVNIEIRLIIFFAGEDREALYSQQNKSWSWLWLRSWTLYSKIQA